MSDEGLDAIGVPTEPFVLERWSYIQRRDSRTPLRPRGHTVGVLLGSNESRFLLGQRVKTFDAIPNTESLVRLLAAQRVPYVMIDDWSFASEAAALGYPSTYFRSAIVRYVPLGAYFSTSFTAENPGFIASFNEAISDCVHEGRKVAPWEEEVLWREVDRIMAGAREGMLDYLESHRALDQLDPLLSRIEALAGTDDAWRQALLDDRMNTLMEVIMANPLSDYLRDVAADHSSITEIFVMNEDGFIVGLNRLTSDYWQGDEAAAEAILQGGAARHHSAFEYDVSTRRFQVKLSLPLFDRANASVPIGMVTIGIDAAGLLIGETH